MAVQPVAVCCSTLEGDMLAVCSHVFDVLFSPLPWVFAKIRGSLFFWLTSNMMPGQSLSR